MSTPDIAHLASLSRISLTESEVARLQTEIADIVGYVSAIQSLTTEAVITKHLGARANVLRSDVVTNEPGAYTERLLTAAPETEDGYVVVKKIINPNDR